MINLEITTATGVKTVSIPSGWHEVSYQYYMDRIRPFIGDDLDPIESNIKLVNSLLETQATEANVMEFGKVIEILLDWMEEAPKVDEFQINDETFKIPVLGKANGEPFMSVGDFENCNDAMKFLQDSDLDDQDTANIGLIVLSAIARGNKELDDHEFSRRLKLFKDISMDVILSACFFFLQYILTFEKDTQHFLIKQIRTKVSNLLPDTTLDGLRLLSVAHNQVYLRSLHLKAQS